MCAPSSTRLRPSRGHRVRGIVSPLLSVWALSACSPALDWRDVRPADSAVTLLMPCRPSVQTRQVQLAGQAVKLALHACRADGATWALAFADVGNPGAIGAALQALQRSAAANVGAAASQPMLLPAAVPGATPHVHSTRVRLKGALPDGRGVDEIVAVFAYGTTVFQATVLSERLSDEAVEVFLGSLRVGR